VVHALCFLIRYCGCHIVQEEQQLFENNKRCTTNHGRYIRNNYLEERNN
jgi:hypothetical protein